MNGMLLLLILGSNVVKTFMEMQKMITLDGSSVQMLMAMWLPLAHSAMIGEAQMQALYEFMNGTLLPGINVVRGFPERQQMTLLDGQSV
jgi:hypothetical protein